MKRFVQIQFIIIVELFFLWSILSSTYYATSWRKNNYIKYLPEHPVYPQYNLTTGEVTNSAEVTVWSISDYVPSVNMIVENIFNCFAKYWLVILSFLLVFILPVYYFTGRGKNNKLFLVTYYQLLMIAVMVLVWI